MVDERLLFLERLSYPLYVVHWPVLLVLCHALAGHLPPPVLGVIVVAAASASAWLTMLVYDEPVRAWLTRRFDGRRTPAGDSEPQPALSRGQL